MHSVLRAFSRIRPRPLWGLCAALLCVSALTLGGCYDGAMSTTQSLRPQESNPQGFASWTDAVPEYRINPGDRLRVQFLLTPELAEEAVVAPDGSIGLRAAGQIQAQGMTLRQLQDAITAASARMLNNPVVTVSIADPAGARIFVGGSVQHPGVYGIDARRGALEAILLAGGFDRESRADEVVVIRRNPDNKPMLRTVDLRNFLSVGATAGDVPLYPGDIVYVPRNYITEVDLWIEQFITKFVPFNRSFDYAINHGTTGGAGFF